jgi:GTP-binding protein HflX
LMRQPTNAILVEAIRSQRGSGLPELRQLAESAGYSVTMEFQQTRAFNSSFCVGRGKAKEIAEKVREIAPAKVIFNNRLKPMQRYNLTKLLHVEVIDRFQLILEIFTSRAGTVEAKHQIELAKLQYELPMARENVRLAKIGELPGFHGLGKYQADVYSTMIKRRITYLKRKLEEVSGRKSLSRTRRKEQSLFNIALTGYTSAGKTTLFNRLTQESLPEGDGLFTTLATTTRGVIIEGKKVLFSDTVGFIDDLPHLLVEAFYSTLEEVSLADKVILILDASDVQGEFERKLMTCISTLNEIGVFNSKIIPVLNKADKACECTVKEGLVKGILGSMPVTLSARTGAGLERLVTSITPFLPPTTLVKIQIPNGARAEKTKSLVMSIAKVKSVSYASEGLSIIAEVAASNLPKLERMKKEQKIVAMEFAEAR